MPDNYMFKNRTIPRRYSLSDIWCLVSWFDILVVDSRSKYCITFCGLVVSKVCCEMSYMYMPRSTLSDSCIMLVCCSNLLGQKKTLIIEDDNAHQSVPKELLDIFPVDMSEDMSKEQPPQWKVSTGGHWYSLTVWLQELPAKWRQQIAAVWHYAMYMDYYVTASWLQSQNVMLVMESNIFNQA